MHRFAFPTSFVQILILSMLALIPSFLIFNFVSLSHLDRGCSRYYVASWFYYLMLASPATGTGVGQTSDQALIQTERGTTIFITFRLFLLMFLFSVSISYHLLSLCNASISLHCF